MLLRIDYSSSVNNDPSIAVPSGTVLKSMQMDFDLDVLIDCIHEKKGYSLFGDNNKLSEIREECFKIISKYKGHIVCNYLLDNCDIQFSSKLIMYLKLQNINLSIKRGEIFINNDLRVADAIYDGILTLKEYHMIMNEIYNNYPDILCENIYEGIVFDTMKNCKEFVKFLKCTYNVSTKIIVISR